MKALKDILKFEIIDFKKYSLSVLELATVFFIFLITYLVLWLIKKALLRKGNQNKFDTGNTYSLFQIIKYIIWIISISLMLETIGIKLTLLLAGSAALLVGVGLGLQQTFNDILSGIILLSSRSIKIDDILEIDGDIIIIQEIGLRTSSGLNRDDISFIIPNSLITSNKIINWSHQNNKTRFRIQVGVAYGSDVDLVMNLLKESAMEHPEIIDKSAINTRFLDFGQSSLDFELLFFSNNIFRIENVKSDVRKIINSKFIAHGVTIPFPQMDLHIKSKN
ncbi:MAG: mechanosensitive ion channel [bacterium]|nr:mechanosensitive ion channel [bacterium]